MYRLRADRVSFQRMGDEGVLLDLGSSTYLSVNIVATSVFERLASSATGLETLVDDVCAAYDVPADVARDDVRELLDDLVARGLVELTDEE